MYRVSSIPVAELKTLWHKDQSGSSPTLSKDTTLSGEYRVTYASAPRFDTVLEHYLNEHVPATWRLISCSIEGGHAMFVWSVD